MREPVSRPGAAECGPVQVQQRADGSLLLIRTEPLAPYPLHLAQSLLHWAARVPERPFIARRTPQGDWQHITYGEMLERARRIGQALVARGLAADRPLIILSENDLEHASLAMAALYAGVPFAPVSPAYSLVSRDFARLKNLVSLLTPGLVYAADGERFGPALAAAVPRSVEVAVRERPPAGRDASLFQELLDTSPRDAVEAAHDAIGPESIAKFLFTSGSTDWPKAVINTQRMLCSNQQVIRQAFPFLRDEPPVLVDWLPWNHTFGGNHNFGLTLYNGGTLYIDDGKPMQPQMQETLRNLREVSPTVYFNVPKGYEELVQALDAEPALCGRFFRRLRMLFYSGAGLPGPIAERLYAIAERYCGRRLDLYTSFGMTETAPFAIGPARVGTIAGAIGHPAPGVTAKLVPSQGKLELRYRGPNVTPGYWRSDERTKAAFDEEGFLRSGDAVRFLDPACPEHGLAYDGRLGEDFKLSSGTWVSINPLRAAALMDGAPCILDVVVTGHDRDEVGLLIFPRLDSCRQLSGLHAEPAAAVLDAASVRAFFQHMVDRLCARGTGAASRVARALLLEQPPAIDRGELTDKGSINQRAVLENRRADVDRLYSDSADVLKAHHP